MADIASQIKKQMEFYFGDSNFSKDKFLRALAAQNSEGYVPLSKLLTFSRLQKLSEDIPTIVEALANSEVVEVNSEKTMIKRKKPLPDTDTSMERTIYAKGFKPGYTIEEVEKLMTPFGKVVSVRIRKTKEKQPKESCWIEFSSVDDVNNVLKVTKEKPIKVEDAELLIKSKADYTAMKKEEIRKKKEEKKKQTDGENPKDEEGAPAAKKQKRSRDDNKEAKPEVEHPKGTLLAMKDVADDVTREMIKDVYAEYGKVAFVDFTKGDKEGIIRFDSSEATQKAAKSEKPLGGKAPTLTPLTDEESDAYWAKLKEKRGGDKGGRGGKNNRGKKRRRF